MSAPHATATPAWTLRDGRQIVHITRCPHCECAHFTAANGTLAYVPCGDNRIVLLDGLGSARR